MKIYRTSVQMVLDNVVGEEVEHHTVLDDAGNEPPPTARLVDVDEAREAILEALLQYRDTFGMVRVGELRLGADLLVLLPEGE